MRGPLTRRASPLPHDLPTLGLTVSPLMLYFIRDDMIPSKLNLQIGDYAISKRRNDWGIWRKVNNLEMKSICFNNDIMNDSPGIIYQIEHFVEGNWSKISPEEVQRLINEVKAGLL